MRNLVRRVSLLALMLPILVVMGSFWAGPASAHAALVGTDPEDGSSLSAAPPTITFTFNENVGNAIIAVTAPDGSKVKVTKARAVDQKISAAVTDVEQKGTYTAAYRVVSADGHPVSGTITYAVTTGRTVDQVQQPESRTFIHRHSGHLFWGILAAAVAVALLLAPLRRRNDADHA